MPRRILVTGGAGFIGSNIAVALAERHADAEVVALDNLYRRGSELTLPRLRAAGVTFAHGDVRILDDLLAAGAFDAMVECSAEPSVLAGGSYLVQSNLLGAHHCFEAAARHGAQVVFLSTSRVYPVPVLDALGYVESEERYDLAAQQAVPGASEHGIAEDLPLEGVRTLYGATKLAGELLLTEVAALHGLPYVINRCGVIAGPWQMGKVDQGVFTHWALSHVFARPLKYLGFGGTGRQVRDVLHVADLVDLVDRQLAEPAHWDGRTFNVGGGREGSLSLRQTTDICRELTGTDLDIGSEDETRAGDVRYYVSDCRRLFDHTDWRPTRSPRDVIADTVAWIRSHEDLVRSAL